MKRWNPAHFGEVSRKCEDNGQLTIFWEDEQEPPDPDDYSTIALYEQAWERWLANNQWFLGDAIARQQRIKDLQMHLSLPWR